MREKYKTLKKIDWKAIALTQFFGPLATTLFVYLFDFENACDLLKILGGSFLGISGFLFVVVLLILWKDEAR